MIAGVTVIDPATTWVDVTVELEPDVTLEPGVQLRGETVVHRGATVGPDSTLTDDHVGEGRVRTYRGASVDHRLAAQLHPWLERDIRLELDRDIYPGRRGIDHRDSGKHPVGEHPAVELGAEDSELSAIVDALDKERVVAPNGPHGAELNR